MVSEKKPRERREVGEEMKNWDWVDCRKEDPDLEVSSVVGG